MVSDSSFSARNFESGDLQILKNFPSQGLAGISDHWCIHRTLWRFTFCKGVCVSCFPCPRVFLCATKEGSVFLLHYMERLWRTLICYPAKRVARGTVISSFSISVLCFQSTAPSCHVFLSFGDRFHVLSWYGRA